VENASRVARPATGDVTEFSARKKTERERHRKKKSTKEGKGRKGKRKTGKTTYNKRDREK
jgi:hypothetical protein